MKTRAKSCSGVSKGVSNPPRRRLLSALVAQAISVPLAAQAATITVTTTADDGTDCTLREAIVSLSNAGVGATGCVNSGAAFGTGDTIVFAESVSGNTISLSAANGDIPLASSDLSVSIDPGGNMTTIQAANNYRVFDIANVSGYTVDIEIDMLTLTGGSPAGAGGAIFVRDASLTVKNSVLTGNSSGFSGGAISGQTGADISITGTTIDSNTVSGEGGGIFIESSTSRLELDSSTVSGNSATGIGGGLVVEDADTATLLNSTISGNEAGNDGGGIHANGLSPTVTLTNSTVYGNSTGDDGGGIYADSNATVNLVNSIVANSLSGYDCDRSFGTVNAGNDNIIVSDDCSTSADNSAPLLQPLADNGGLTQTHALGSGSAAIDNGNANNGACPDFDQRGAARDDGTCDLGAFEVKRPIEVTSALDNGGGAGECTLREAIESVNNGYLQSGCYHSPAIYGTADQVVFAPAVEGQTITLTGGVIDIMQSISINPGGGQTTVDAGGNSQIFSIDTPIDTPAIFVEIDALTLTGGYEGTFSGGAISVNDASLSLLNSTISGNTANGGGGGILAFSSASVGLSNSMVTDNFSYVGGGLFSYGATLELSNSSTVSGNTATGGEGGGIFADQSSSLTVMNSTVSSNSVNGIGGGISADQSVVNVSNTTVFGNTAATNCGGVNGYRSDVTVTDSTVSNNTATEFGGGLCSDNNSILMITGSTVSGNSISQYDGGGLSASDNADVTISNSTISSNVTTGESGDGGGVAVIDATTSLTVSNSTLMGNTASGKGADGGGIYSLSANVTINQSTISGNTAVSTASTFNFGGGVYFYKGTATITNSTVSGNTADDSSGGVGVVSDAIVTITNTTISDNSAASAVGLQLYEFNGNPAVDLTNTIIANSSGGADCGTNGTYSLGAQNSLIESYSCGLTDGNNGNIVGSDPQLADLSDNGGPTQTHLLMAGSPAIDAGDNGTCEPTDQRGAPRDASCDIGAFEAGAIDMDLGDAPTAAQSGLASDYPTVLADDGARHEDTGLTLGATRDPEADGQPTGTADGDDTNGNDDEDGVTFTETPSTGNSTAVTVNVSAAGELDAWVDFNQDGDWDDAGEQIFDDEAVTNGINGLTLSTPFDATEGTTYARFRVSAEGVAEPTGFADDGEVEDYQITIENGDSDDDGMPDDYEEDNGLDPNVDDADDDEDGDGLTNLEEFNAGTRADTPDTDGDSIGDAFDNDPTVSSNQCGTDPATLSSLNVPDGDVLQCAAETSIEVQSGVTIQSGGRLELISLQVTFGDGFSVPTGGELNVQSTDPTPP